EGDTDEGDTDEGDTDEGGSPRRRRRRRGGRRRRRGGSDADEARDEPTRRGGESQPDEQPADERSGTGPAPAEEPDGRRKRSDSREAADDDGSDESASDDGSGEDSGQRRRRRRRRRRGEDSGPAADDPVEVVVRVREPRSRKQAAEEVTGIQGSTRMEAKRQRRREGREAGRRRAPILSEAEFLARRESVTRKMIIRQREELSQIAVLEDDILVEHYVDRDSAATLIGNVYLGRVQNVLPSMEAAFIDIGRGRNAVLYAGEVDWDAFGANGQQRKVENVLKSGQTVLVQVTKDPVGAKGARLTSHVTLPGRYIVYAPGGHLSGISRKLPDTERKRLKSVLSDLVPESASVIVRTAAEGASEDELVRDVNRLKAQWEDIERKVKQGSAPKLLYGEPDLTVRIVRDLFTEDFAELIIQGNGSQADAYDAVEGYVSHVAPHLHDRLRRWDAAADGDLFAKFRLDEQIAKALERKVFLPSGGSLIIDRTEAMTVIDVNTGKFTGSGGNLEATVTSNNLEAAEEIVRQLRLRDIGGIIVIDFIDMVLPSNRELLLRRLVECLGRDRTRHQVAEVTSLGLVQMTRKKIGTGLLEAFTSECEHCHGRGYEIFDMPVETQKQPDGGSRDQRGGGGRDRGRGRSNQSGSGGNGKQQHPVPTPPQHRPEPAPEQQPDRSGTAADVAAEPAADLSPEPAAGESESSAEPGLETTTADAAPEGVPAS
ncbi:MAG TPA: Rne/Rng family ribonuclease, partial [Microlunatus sp.]|nr:Rne/Rng family ribonuclease [Microlunatus sp.]